MSRLVPLFLALAVVFTIVHAVAVYGYLYWYLWWFDIFMHLWGGLLLGLGVHTLTTLRIVPLRPTLPVLLLTITVAVVSWEVFERIFGLYGSDGYLIDTATDISLGYVGGLLAHSLLTRRTMS